MISMIPGEFWDISEDWTILKDGSVFKEDGTLLCQVVRGYISQSLCDTAFEVYLAAGKIASTNRGYAAGSKKRNVKDNYEQGAGANSGVIGYLDSMNHKRPCRLSAFSRDHFQEYSKGLPFIEEINKCYKQCMPYIHSKQYIKAQESKEFAIKDTAFSTVTVNYNFRTALHKDTGDTGMACISVVSHDITGGLLLFPEYKVGVELKTGDILVADVHEWHCNSPIIGTGHRLSFVCYLRENMHKCRTVNERLNGVIGELSNKEWNTSIIFDKIFEIDDGCPSKEITSKGWWSMESVHFRLTYKNKRYILFDKEKNVKVHNLLPAWEYVNKTYMSPPISNGLRPPASVLS